MTRPELLREMGVHLKKVVDIYNQLAKNPDAFTPGEIDMLVNNAAKIIEFAAVMKHQPASVTNSDEQIRLRDMEDKLRVLSEELKNKEFELEKLHRSNQELEKKVAESKHLVDVLKVDIPEITQQIDTNSTLAKNDLLENTLTHQVTQIDQLKKEEVSANLHTTHTHTLEKQQVDVPPKTLVSKYENETDGTSKKTVISSLNESIIDGSVENLAEKMMNAKIVDLKKVIPLHEKFHYTNELFGKNGDHYSQFIEAMNTKQTWKEAEGLLAQAASMYKWDPENKTALQFIALIQRRFN